jgi:hypothetical protein
MPEAAQSPSPSREESVAPLKDPALSGFRHRAESCLVELTRIRQFWVTYELLHREGGSPGLRPTAESAFSDDGNAIAFLVGLAVQDCTDLIRGLSHGEIDAHLLVEIIDSIAEAERTEARLGAVRPCRRQRRACEQMLADFQRYLESNPTRRGLKTALNSTPDEPVAPIPFSLSRNGGAGEYTLAVGGHRY